MRKMNITIRKAELQEVDSLAKLIYSTEVHPQEVWGCKNKEECLEVLKELFIVEKSRYNLKYISVAEKEGNVLGVIILIPYNELDSLSFKTYKKVIHYYESVYDKFNYILYNFKYTIFRECRKGNLYIANVATVKESRGLGIGKLLMKYAEETAKKKGFKGISLVAKNENVSNFYKKLKYKKTLDIRIFGGKIIKMSKFIL